MSLAFIPNAITVLRLLLIVPFAWLLFAGDTAGSLLMFVIAGLSDGLDGFIARRYRWQSAVGGFLDPLADKLLMFVAYMSLAWLAILPWWITFLVVGRDVVISLGAFIYRMMRGPFQAEPIMLSKINTTLQIALVVIFMSREFMPWPPWLLDGLLAGVLLSTISSGIAYVVIWSKRPSGGER